jgi:hypothetical protein
MSMRFRIDTLLLAAIVASASLAVCAQTAPPDPAPSAAEAKAKAAAKKADDKKKADEKKKAEAKKRAEAKKKAEEKAEAKAEEPKAARKPPTLAPKTPTTAKVKQPGPGGPIVERRTVTDKGSSPFTLTDKDGKVVPTAPDAYDVSSATPPKKR